MKQINGILEFTWFLLVSVPEAYHLFKTGQPFNINTYKGMEDFLYFCPDKISYSNKETDLHCGFMDLYKKDFQRHILTTWTPPPYKEFYCEEFPIYDKPTVIINNKYISEWLGPPQIYLSIKTVLELIQTLQDKYKIIYIRSRQNETGYHADRLQIGHYEKELDDHAQIAAAFPETVFIQDVIDGYGLNFNEAQLRLMANSEKHIAVAGGNAALSSYFGGELLIKNCHNCKAKDRGIWHTDSWLSRVSGSKVFGYQQDRDLIEHIKQWL